MPVFITNTVHIQRYANAVYGIQVGSATMAQVDKDITSLGGIDKALNAYYAGSGQSNATVAANIVKNVGIVAGGTITAQAVTDATAYVLAQLNANKGNEGSTIKGILNSFGTMTADAVYGAAATKFNADVDNALAYTGSTDVAVGSVVSANAFTLTADVNMFVGGAGADVFGATNATLQSFDTVNGGAGHDKLVLSLAGDYTGGASITNIEEIVVTTDGSTRTTSLAGVAGVTTLTSASSGHTAVFTGVGAIVTANVSGSATGATITYADAATSGTADAMTLNLSRATGGTVTLNNTTLTTTNAGIETLNIVSSDAANTITLVTGASGATASLGTINVSGTQNLSLTTSTNVTTSATKIDASALTGTFTVAGLGSGSHTVTGGSAGDTFNFGANLSNGDVINGGGGTDTLGSNGAAFAAATTTSRPTVTSIETLFVIDDLAATATTIDTSVFGAITNIRIADQISTDAAAMQFNNLTAAASGSSNSIRFEGNVGATTGTYGFDISGASVAGNENAVTLDMRGVATTATSTFTLSGVETITIDTTNATGAKTFNLTDTSLKSLIVKGAQSVDVDGAGLSAGVTSVDASGLTGTAGLNVALSTSNGSGAIITTANGNDLVAGSQLADKITLGGGDDSVTGGLGADSINVGSGTDTVLLTATGQTGVVTAMPANGGTLTLTLGTYDVITGMGNGDVINLGGNSYTATGTANADSDTFGTAVAVATLTANGATYVRGGYNGDTGVFTRNDTGADTIIIFDANAATNATSYETIVLVGTAVTSIANAESGTSDTFNLTLTV